MNLLLPRSDRRRFFLLSDFQSNALHGDINKIKLSKTLLPPFFLTSTAAKPLNNAAVPLRTFLSGNEYPSKRRRRPPLIPLRKHKPLKTSPQASSYPSPETQTPQIVAAGLRHLLFKPQTSLPPSSRGVTATLLFKPQTSLSPSSRGVTATAAQVGSGQVYKR